MSEAAYAEMMASTTLLNRVGETFAQDEDVHAMTDVTGFGLLGHGLELARGARVSLDIDYQHIPFLAQAEALAEAGYATGASERNWASYGDDVVLPPELPAWQRVLLTDPQTSGGLLIACDCRTRCIHPLRRSRPPAILARRIIGSVSSGEPAVRII